jgi:phosphoribosylformimino-5-aminoimidazole carboxamide ribotide isomerase
MELIPAIDLKDGRCVRLYQGDYRRETVYSDDPVAVALHWQSLGAPRLHLVDLDGAVAGEPANLGVIADIVRRTWIPLQLGGGIRSIAVIDKLLRLGLERVVLGTVAAEQPDLVREACERFGDAVVVGIDARKGFVAVRGWQADTHFRAAQLLSNLADAGVARIIYTDIERDGTLTEPNYKAIAELMASAKMAVTASGGISSSEHLRRLSRLGVEGAIIGKALYSGVLDYQVAARELGQ